jgi:hypothetical protein
VHACAEQPSAAQPNEISLELDLPSGASRSAPPPRVSSAVGLAAHGREPLETSALVWRFLLTDGREIVAELDPGTTVETVRVAGRIVSRSGAGGMPQGHAIRVGASALDPADGEKPYRGGAAPGEGLLRIDPAMRACTLTVDGLTIKPSSKPAPLSASPAPPPRTAYDRAGPIVIERPRPPSSSPVGIIVAVVIVIGLIGGAFAIGRGGMIALGGIGLIIAFVGAIMLLVAAFSESVLWGLVCLLLPGATLIFVVTHWDRTKRGATTYLLGAIFLCVSGGGSAYFAKRDGTYEANARAPAPTASGPICAADDEPPEGFSRWCCTPKGWVATDTKGCTSVLKPSDDCDQSAIGTSTVTGCGTLGGGDRRRR